MQTPRLRAAIEYVIDGDLRFLSHHDEIRMLMRALVRAGWPISYSEGFNPQPRLSLPLPRRVGTASDSQWAIVDLCGTQLLPMMSAQALFESLSPAAPPGVPVRGVTAPLPPGTPHALAAFYAIQLLSADAIAPRVADILDRTAIVVQRSAGPGKPVRAIDIRPLLENLVLDGVVLRMRLAFEGQRSARPIEILTTLGLTASDYEHRVRQTGIIWDMELAGPNRWPAAQERNSLVKEENSCRGGEAARSQEEVRSAC